jgi:hypothetical protein
MGSLTDNLLNLEFPFSYSLIWLLALIFGQGINLGEASLARLDPLIILMGFVATTLSITDPLVSYRAHSSNISTLNFKAISHQALE